MSEQAATPIASADQTAVQGPKDTGKFPWRPSMAQFFATIGWYAPFFGISAALLPAKLAQVAPDQKADLLAQSTTVAMFIAIFAGIIFGALSDMTRTRWGGRSPWVILGAIFGTIGLLVFALSGNIVVVMCAWFFYVICYNAIMSAGMAWMPDLIPVKYRGSASAIFGVATQIGLNGAQSLGSLFITNVPTGVFILLVISDVLLFIAVVVCREPSNLGKPRGRFDVSKFRDFLPPMHAGRDYWFAAFARFMFMMPGGIGTYRLFTLTDYMHQSDADAAKWMSFMALLNLILAVISAAIAGPLADFFKTIKIPCALAVFAVGIPCWLPFFIPNPLMYTIYVAFSGLGGGIFISLDQALMTSVLPNNENAAKDLAFLNAAGTVGQLLAPLLAFAVLKAFGYAGLFPMGFIVLTLAAVSIFGIKRIK
ncbi:MFS transporter [Bifidobacterium sp. MA2]|uniref:MFS transporter n=1 Tax=Bifidobacterium santillanense TaxID=2809028 RepID=A0ABS5UPD6_9BIFI|nr:MFS transporter [Bifidobacterium santillanense]MBT1172741.1 MFS transporter [Bifidobacterium santillanense]